MVTQTGTPSEVAVCCFAWVMGALGDTAMKDEGGDAPLEGVVPFAATRWILDDIAGELYAPPAVAESSLGEGASVDVV